MHKSWGDLVKDTQFKQAFDKINKPKKGSLSTANSSSRTVMEAQYGFTILDIPANVVVSGDVTAYTFLITRDNTPATVFENLIINLVSNQEPKAYIHRFESNVAYGNSPIDISKFQGTSTMTPILYNASQSNSLNDDVEFFCVEVSIWSCGNHSEYVPGCQGHGSTGYVCEVSVGAGNHNSGGGSGGDSSSESSSNDTSTSSGTYSSGTNGGSSGQPVVVTAPVGPPVDLITKTCTELKKLSNSDPIKAAFQNLETKTLGDTEFGFAVRKSPSVPNTLAPPTTTAINVRNPKKLVMTPYLDGSWLGVAHNHPNPRIGPPMFSGGDVVDGLFALAQAATNANPNQVINYQEFFLALTGYDIYSQTNMTFAIKINNWTTFNAFFSVQANADAFEVDLSEEYTKLYKEALEADQNAVEGVNTPPTMEKMQRVFLNAMKKNNVGMGLFQADPDLDNWSELKLDPLDKKENPKEIIKATCN